MRRLRPWRPSSLRTAHLKRRRCLLDLLWSFSEPRTLLGEEVCVCTGPTTSRQVPGIGRTLSLFIHHQGNEASCAVPRPSSLTGRAIQFRTDGVHVPQGPVPPRLDVLWEILGKLERGGACSRPQGLCLLFPALSCSQGSVSCGGCREGREHMCLGDHNGFLAL